MKVFILHSTIIGGWGEQSSQLIGVFDSKEKALNAGRLTNKCITVHECELNKVGDYEYNIFSPQELNKTTTCPECGTNIPERTVNWRGCPNCGSWRVI